MAPLRDGFRAWAAGGMGTRAAGGRGVILDEPSLGFPRGLLVGSEPGLRHFTKKVAISLSPFVCCSLRRWGSCFRICAAHFF